MALNNLKAMLISVFRDNVKPGDCLVSLKMVYFTNDYIIKVKLFS